VSLEPGAGTVELRAGRVRNLLFALLFAGFAIIGVVAALSLPAAWFGAVFFGALAVALVVSTLRSRSGLELAPEGFTVRSLTGGERIAWGDVRRFRVGRQPGRGAMVAYDLRAGDQEGVLPDNYGMHAEELAELLELWRQEGPMHGRGR
jgi:uncharacterized protein (DUF58 family)